MSSAKEPTGEYVRPEELAFLKTVHDTVLRHRNLDITSYNNRFVLRRVAVRERSAGCQSHTDYLNLLASRPEEISELLKELSIGVSEFFRDPGVFSCLQLKLLPALIKKVMPSPKRPIRVWSAGSSCGEEAYSISILLEGILEHVPYASAYHITGSDIDIPSLETARLGMFTQDKLKNVPAVYLEQFFDEPDSEGKSKIRTSCRSRVSFIQHDLFSDFCEHDFDLVLCRNVLMYFSSSNQEKVLRLITRALRPGGFLVLGQVDRLIGSVSKAFDAAYPDERIYQKKID